MGYIGNQPQYDITVNKKQYTASAGQTTFAIGYDTYVDVYVDGVLLAISEYNATTGTSVVLNTPLSGGEVVQLSGFTTLGVATTVQSITRTAGDGSSGATDTYTITMTDGTTSTFNVYNGIDGLPDQTGFAGKYLKTDGTVATWESASTGTGITNNEFIATAGQTVFTVTYSVGSLEVYRNGLLLAVSDYTAIDGTSVILNVGAVANDIINVKTYDTFDVANTYTKGEVDSKDSLKQDTLVSGTNIKTINGASVLGSGNMIVGGTVDYQEFTTSGTWTKPDGINYVYVEVLGAGGGGGNMTGNTNTDRPSGGGGGAFVSKILKAADVGSSEIVTVGAGGAGAPSGTNGNGIAGGNSSFGSLVVGLGGCKGGIGDPRSMTDIAFGGGGTESITYIDTSSWRGDSGVSCGSGSNYLTASGGNSIFGGAGGGGALSTSRGLGGFSQYAGAGGAGNINLNVKAGNGTYPAGGGGGSNNNGGGGDGANGRVRVWCW